MALDFAPRRGGTGVRRLIWLWKVDRVPLTQWDLVGAGVTLAGMKIIVWGGWRA
jgi:drug/metabolite transporter superfamily protein YnfA